MIFVLFFLLIIAAVVIYKLIKNSNDDQIIKSNYSWKERIRTLENLIEYTKTKEERELSEREIANGVKTNKEQIQSYLEEIAKLQSNIYNNEQYLKTKGK